VGQDDAGAMAGVKPDPQEEAAVRLILLQCQHTGSDPVRALNERGFLLYKAKHQQAVRDVMNQVADALDNTTASFFGAQASRSPNDMKAAIAEHLRKIYREE